MYPQTGTASWLRYSSGQSQSRFKKRDSIKELWPFLSSVLFKYLKNKKCALLIYVTLDLKSGQKHKYES